MSIRQRFSDWRRERRIHDLSAEITWCLEAGMRDYAHTLDRERIALINGRSPAQVARMERARGLA